jgi:hypothetical protein
MDIACVRNCTRQLGSLDFQLSIFYYTSDLSRHGDKKQGALLGTLPSALPILLTIVYERNETNAKSQNNYAANRS